jgi:hypothetical protein
VIIFMVFLFAIDFFSFSRFLYLYLRIGSGNHNVFKSHSQDWTVGQIIPLTVWCPVVSSLLDNAIHGPVQGHTEQLPDSLKVVRVSTSLSTDEETGIELLNAITSASSVHEQPTIVDIHERRNTAPTRRTGSGGEEHAQLARHTLP